MRYLDLVKLIKSDKQHGATWLSIKAVEAFIALAEELWGAEKLKREAKLLLERLSSCRPSVVAIANAAKASYKVLEEQLSLKADKQKVLDELLKLRNDIEQAKLKVAENAVNELSRYKRFLTHSLSSTVLEFFKKLGSNDRLVVVTESRPLLEGVETAKALSSMGFKVKLIADVVAYHAIKEFDVEIFVFGADAVSREGFVVNKAGTATLAVSAKSLGVFNTCLCESVKVCSCLPQSLEIGDPRELLKESLEGVEAFNLYFDVTSPNVIDAIILEDGVKKPPYSLKPLYDAFNIRGDLTSST